MAVSHARRRTRRHHRKTVFEGRLQSKRPKGFSQASDRAKLGCNDRHLRGMVIVDGRYLPQGLITPPPEGGRLNLQTLR